MITIEEYKKYLIDYYKYEIDNNNEKRIERTKELSRKYNDELLNKIIVDTYDFIKDIFNSDTINKGYCSFELEDDTTSILSLNICGGGIQDTIITDMNDRNISKYILKKTFGKSLEIDVREEEYYYSDDDIIIGIDYNYSLYLQGFPNNMNEIKKELFNNKQLVKK